MYNLSILAIFMNESMVIEEWLQHYIWQGVEHFYLIDNGSTDNYEEVIGPYLDKISLVKWDETAAQIKHYNQALDHFDLKNQTKWLLVCDLDEFLFSPTFKNLQEYLGTKEGTTCINVSMTMFGSRDEYEQPPSIRKGFLHREKRLHDHGKAILRTKSINKLDVHFHDVDGNTIRDDIDLQLNHYQIMSKEYFDKVKKPRPDVAFSENPRDDEYFKRRDIREMKDTKLADMLPSDQDTISGFNGKVRRFPIVVPALVVFAVLLMCSKDKIKPFLMLFVILLFVMNTDRETFNKNELVVARCGEDIGCLDNFKDKFNVTVYDKCGNALPDSKILPNMGRESHTYLQHIIDVYDSGSLPEVTVFLIGSCCRDSHKTKRMNQTIDLVNKTKNSVFIGGLAPEDENFELPEYKGAKMDRVPAEHRPFPKWVSNIVKKPRCPISTGFGVFAVHRDHILQNPKEYYQGLLDSFPQESSNPEVGHYFERAWGHIFGPVPDECIYVSTTVDDYYPYINKPN